MQTNIPTRISLSFPRYGPGIRLYSTVVRLPYNCLSSGVDFSLNTGDGGQSGQTIKLLQITPISTISKHSIISVPVSLHRGLEKLVLPSIFDTHLSSCMM